MYKIYYDLVAASRFSAMLNLINEVWVSFKNHTTIILEVNDGSL